MKRKIGLIVLSLILFSTGSFCFAKSKNDEVDVSDIGGFETYDGIFEKEREKKGYASFSIFRVYRLSPYEIIVEMSCIDRPKVKYDFFEYYYYNFRTKEKFEIKNIKDMCPCAIGRDKLFEYTGRLIDIRTGKSKQFKNYLKPVEAFNINDDYIYTSFSEHYIGHDGFQLCNTKTMECREGKIIRGERGILPSEIIKINDNEYLLAEIPMGYFCGYAAILNIEKNTLEYIWAPLYQTEKSGCAYVGNFMFFRYPNIRKWYSIRDYFKYRTHPSPHKNVIKVLKFENGELNYTDKFTIRNVKEDLHKMWAIPIGKNRIMFLGRDLSEEAESDTSDVYVLDYVKKKAVMIEQKAPFTNEYSMVKKAIQMDEGKWLLYNVRHAFVVISMKGKEKW